MYVNIKYSKSKFGTSKLNLVKSIIAVIVKTIVASVIDVAYIK